MIPQATVSVGSHTFGLNFLSLRPRPLGQPGPRSRHRAQNLHHVGGDLEENVAEEVECERSVVSGWVLGETDVFHQSQQFCIADVGPIAVKGNVCEYREVEEELRT